MPICCRALFLSFVMDRLPFELLERIAQLAANADRGRLSCTSFRLYEACRRSIEYTVDCRDARGPPDCPDIGEVNISSAWSTETPTKDALRLVKDRPRLQARSTRLNYVSFTGCCSRGLTSTDVDCDREVAAGMVLKMMNLLPNLRQVRVRGFSLPFSRLCKALHSRSHLVRLDIEGRAPPCSRLSDAQSGSVSLYELCAIVAACASLTHLSADRIRPTGGSRVAPQTSWPAAPSRLQSLSLKGVVGTDEELSLLLGSQRDTLRDLTIAPQICSGLTPDGLRDAIGGCKSLESLALASLEDFGDASSALLGGPTHHFPRLRHVVTTARALDNPASLRSFPALRRLDFMDGFEDDLGAAFQVALIAALERRDMPPALERITTKGRVGEELVEACSNGGIKLVRTGSIWAI